jgi:hypothetical protein
VDAGHVDLLRPLDGTRLLWLVGDPLGGNDTGEGFFGGGTWDGSGTSGNGRKGRKDWDKRGVVW